MDDDEESTFLAYTKSPKITKRTSFQDELKKAVTARVSRQPAVQESENLDYSDEFESDDSLEDSYLKNKPTKSKFQKSLHNFHFSDDDDEDEDDSPVKRSFLKSKRQDSKGGSESGRPKTPSFESHEKKEHFPAENKDQRPTPKPRESRMKLSPSPPGSGFSPLDESFKPMAQHRNKAPLSAPSSLARLDEELSSSEAQQRSGRISPEGFRISKSPTPRLKSPPVSEGQKRLTIAKEEPLAVLKDLQIGGEDHKETELRAKETGSPSVLEMMLTNVKEKSIQQENKDPFFSETHKSYDSKEHDERDEQNKINLGTKSNESLKLTQSSSRPSSAPSNKKSAKTMKQNSAKSRYLGTLTLLDKSVYDHNSELEAADTLRATVYQNWLEKKKVFLREVHKLKMEEEEKKKEKIKLEESMKKEEAMAAFMAWKAEKKDKLKEIQKNHKLAEKKMLEELQDIARKKEECRRAFEKWKESKDHHLKQKALKEKVTETEKKSREQETALEKKRSNMTAFETWNQRKELVLKDKKMEIKNEKLKLRKQKSEKEEKERRALEMYEEWLDKKERQEKFEKRQKKLQLLLDDGPPPPWSPPGRTIPAGR